MNVAGSERTSSPRPQIAKQNCTTEEHEVLLAGLCYTRPAFEDAIWRREMRLKGASGGLKTRSAVSPTCVKGGTSATLTIISH
jgi:hypothetical protein